MKNLQEIRESVIDAYQNFLLDGKTEKFREVAPYYMREYLMRIFHDEDACSDAYIRCLERIVIFLDKFHLGVGKKNLIGFLNSCAINQYFNSQKQAWKEPKIFDFLEHLEQIESDTLENDESTEKEILFQFLGTLGSPWNLALALRHDISLDASMERALKMILFRKSRSPLEFWESHRNRRNLWTERKEKLLDRLRFLTFRIYHEKDLRKREKFKKNKENKLKSLNFHLRKGMYTMEELAIELDIEQKDLVRIVRHKLNKWKKREMAIPDIRKIRVA
ncbi:hypothetical protein [Leptospira sp. GIMC2001]|uniref:hypothetical protein n=1 Tax=Leptospira sp. GIMC2001 TaxID=1513297 RepID=UPI00234B836C|nr:hypothetical protein [Leptospira sp. GIMC2001]WCL50254.1 hypothetical protein O4O04_05380 [Leptospira sp. GIMC2001]